MPYDIDWYVDQHVIFWRMFGDKIPLSDVEEVSQVINDMSNQSTFPLVHSIVEIDYTPGFHMKELKEALVHFQNPKTGWTLRFITDRVMGMWGAIVSSQTQTRFRNFETLEECWEFLKSVDSTVPVEPLNLDLIDQIRKTRTD